MKKYLIVSGCSYTAAKYFCWAHPEIDTSYPKWPELLGKKLNMKVMNLAAPGAGNRFILQTLLEAIERTPKQKIGMVMAAWSQANRDDWQDFHITGVPIAFPNEHFISGFKWNNTRIRRPGDIFSWVRESLLGFITLQNVCKRYDIPFKQFQMIGLYRPWISGLMRTETDQQAGLPRYEYKGNRAESEKMIRNLIKDYEKFIDPNIFIGYPKTIHLTDKLSHPMDWSLGIDDQISKIDEHPNKQGQEKLTEIIYDRMG